MTALLPPSVLGRDLLLPPGMLATAANAIGSEEQMRVFEGAVLCLAGDVLMGGSGLIDPESCCIPMAEVAATGAVLVAPDALPSAVGAASLTVPVLLALLLHAASDCCDAPAAAGVPGAAR